MSSPVSKFFSFSVGFSSPGDAKSGMEKKVAKAQEGEALQNLNLGTPTVSGGLKHSRSSRRSKRSHNLGVTQLTHGTGPSYVLPKDYLFKGQMDNYRLKYHITREEAEIIFKQTGFEIPIPAGQDSLSNYVIGSGGFGKVYAGYTESSQRYIAIKVPKESEPVDMVKKELAFYQALKVKSLRHILPVIDHHEVMDDHGDVTLYQVMELAGLGDVDKFKGSLHLLRDKQFREQLLFCLTEGLLQGLAELHQNGFYHLDVKPGNLVIQGNGEIHLVDFGCSQQSDTGIILRDDGEGDIDYLSKERWLATFEGPDFSGAKADAFAAGLTLLILGNSQYSHAPIKALADQLLDESELLLKRGSITVTERKGVGECFEQRMTTVLEPLKNFPKDSFEHLVLSLLAMDVEKRLSPKEALEHAWFQKMKTSSPKWRQPVQAYLREFVQSQQREQRSLGPQDLPFPHFTHFVPRINLQEPLTKRLLSTTLTDAGMTVCQGMGGVGKTQLVTYLLHQPDIQNHFGLKLWFRSADQISSLETQFIGLAREYRLVQDKAEMKEVIDKLHGFLALHAQKAGKPWLIVFDNAEEENSLRPYLPPKGGHCLITTRSLGWKEVISIEVMHETEGQALVQKLLPKAEAETLTLSQTLGHLPLAITQACAYIAAEALSIPVYLERLSKESIALSLLNQDERSFGKKLPSSIFGMWQMTFQTLQQRYPEAYTLLESLSYLSDAIPQALINALSQPEMQAILQRYALLQSSPGIGTVHRVLQLTVRALQAQNEKQVIDTLTRVMMRLNELYEDKPTTLLTRQANLALLPQGEALCQYVEKRKEVLPPALRENWHGILNMLSILQRELGHFHKGRVLSEQALQIAEQCYGPEHSQVAISLNNLGSILADLEDKKKAQEYLERALTISERAYSLEHSQVAISLNNLGRVFNDLGNKKRARECLERALAIYEKVYGIEHGQVVISLNNLGAVLSELGDKKKAREYLERALTISEKVYDADHPEVAKSLNNLGWILDELGDKKKAQKYHERALAIREKIYGLEHREVTASLSGLGLVLADLGEKKKAQEYLERALAIREKIYGSDHPGIGRSLNNLGMVLADSGEEKKAQEYHERALAIWEKVYDADHPDIARSLNNLGMVLAGLGEKKKAQEYLKRAVAIREKFYGPEHPNVARSLNNLGMVLADLGEKKKAQEFYERALAIWEKVYGPEHPDVARSLNNLGKVLADLGEKKRAEELHERALAIQAKEPPLSAAPKASSLPVSFSAGFSPGDAKNGMEKKSVKAQESETLQNLSLATPAASDVTHKASSLGIDTDVLNVPTPFTPLLQLRNAVTQSADRGASASLSASPSMSEGIEENMGLLKKGVT